MFTYAERHFTSEQSLGGLLSSLGQDTGDLPPFIEAQLVFPYVQGQEFIKQLYAAGGWGVVDAAYRFRPPASSEQIMHPDKYLAVEQPDKVRLQASPGAGWRRVVGGTWGEWATGQLVGNEAASGWGGDRYELWQRGQRRLRGAVPRPRRARDALALGRPCVGPPLRGSAQRVERRQARRAGRGLTRPRGRARPRAQPGSG